HGRGLVGQGQGRVAEAVAADADIAETGIPLLVVARAEGGPVVGDDREVDISLLGPDLRRLEDLRLPAPDQLRFAVERREQVTGDPTQVRSIGHEADGHQLGMRPEVARGRVEHDTGFQRLQAGPRLDGGTGDGTLLRAFYPPRKN